MPYKLLNRWPKVGEYVKIPPAAGKPHPVEGTVVWIESRTYNDERRIRLDMPGEGIAGVVARRDEILLSF